jgi:dihydroorotate dehydrogenase
MMGLNAAARLARFLPPETAHRATVAVVGAGLLVPSRELDPPELGVRLKRSGLSLPNPVGLAAGFDKNAEAPVAMLALGFGFVECGTVTPLAQAGNPRPRLFRLSADRAVINRMGFNNEGLVPFCERLARIPAGSGVIGANVGANKDSSDRIGDYVAGLKAVWADSSYVTMNVSSPNTPGLRGLQDRAMLEELLARAGEAALAMNALHGPRPVFLKVAPDLGEEAIDDICEIALAAPVLSGLIVSNTTIARPPLRSGRRSAEAGGLSGRPLMGPSTGILRGFSRRLGGRLDLIGAGGVSSADDVLVKMRAGASAVQLYSALVYEGPGLIRRIKRDLLAFMRREGIARLDDIVGADLG